MTNKYTWITGASAGIGLEIAACMADKGHNLILTARRENILMEASNDISEKYKVKVDFIAADLSDIDAPERIFNYCEENDYEVEVLVNNAGYGIPTSFHETSMEEEEKFIRVLGISVIAMTKIFLSGIDFTTLFGTIPEGLLINKQLCFNSIITN